MNKVDLLSGINEYLKGFRPRYYITLDDASKYSGNHSLELRFLPVMRKTDVLVNWLKPKLLGNKGQDQIRAVGFFEQGKLNNVLHSHVILAMKGETNRSMDWIRNFVHRKWQQLREVHCERQSRYVLTDDQHKLQRFISMSQDDPIFPYEIERDSNTDIKDSR